MDIRYSAHPRDVARYTTEELRREFLITDLYKPDTVQATYSHVDRMVIMGILPVNEVVSIDKGIDVWHNFGTNYFLERREAGVFNLGGKGFIEVDGVRYDLGYEDCLYIAKETKTVLFGSCDPDDPARYYLASTPAHKVEQARHQPVHPSRCPGDLPAFHGSHAACPGQRLELHALPHA